MVDGNKLGDVGFQKIGTPYREMDCQAFVEWCLRQCGCSKDLAGSNAWYREVMKNGTILSPEECVAQLGCVPKGAFLFIHAFDGGEPEKYKPDGLGNASHIGLCTIPRGEGAINSSYSRGCVCESKFKGKTIKGGWSKVGLWNKVDYDYGGGSSGGGGSSPEPEPEPEPTHDWALIGNVPAGNRQDVNFRKKPNVYADLIDRIPVGYPVEVLSNNGEWSKVKWNNQTGYVMSKFLTYYEESGSGLYTVCIQHLDKTQADEIKRNYPQAEVTEE